MPTSALTPEQKIARNDDFDESIVLVTIPDKTIRRLVCFAGSAADFTWSK